VLELLYSSGGDSRPRSVMLSRAPYPCLSLREKVSVAQHINLFLAQLQDGGEAGIAGPKASTGTGQLAV
jgi:hypothetical protein